MKNIILLLLLSCFTSCAAIKRSGEAVCDVHHSVAKGIDSAGAYLGGPGNLVADIMNAGLEMFCKVLKAVTAVPADIADGPGQAVATPEVKDAPEVHGQAGS